MGSKEGFDGRAERKRCAVWGAAGKWRLEGWPLALLGKAERSR